MCGVYLRFNTVVDLDLIFFVSLFGCGVSQDAHGVDDRWVSIRNVVGMVRVFLVVLCYKVSEWSAVNTTVLFLQQVLSTKGHLQAKIL